MVKEFDAVPSLMGRRDSTFRSMVRAGWWWGRRVGREKCAGEGRCRGGFETAAGALAIPNPCSPSPPHLSSPQVVEAGLEGTASGAISRIASQAALADVKEEAASGSGSASPGDAVAASPAGGRPGLKGPGRETFVRRLKDEYDLK